MQLYERRVFEWYTGLDFYLGTKCMMKNDGENMAERTWMINKIRVNLFRQCRKKTHAVAKIPKHIQDAEIKIPLFKQLPKLSVQRLTQHCLPFLPLHRTSCYDELDDIITWLFLPVVSSSGRDEWTTPASSSVILQFHCFLFEQSDS